MNGRWIEVKMRPEVGIAEVADLLGPTFGHAFYDEPWHPRAYVVRMLIEEGIDDAMLDAMGSEWSEWDPGPDEDLYGERWEAVADYFRASTALGEISDFETRKLVHCFLNARGLSWTEEIRFHLREAWLRTKIVVRNGVRRKA